jgi:hypothetical protein
LSQQISEKINIKISFMKKLCLLFAFFMISIIGFSQTTVYHENFESPLFGDSVVSSGTPGWAISTTLHHGGSCSDTSKVATSGTTYLTTSSFNTTGYSNVILQFSHICKINLMDSATVEVSNDNGVSWTKLLAAQYLGTGNFSGNKFSSTSYSTDWAPANDLAIPLNTWWKTEQFDISALAGNGAQIQVRFRLKDGGTPGGANSYGWLIDDILINASVSELIPPVITLNIPIVQDTVYTTGPFTISAAITDNSGIAWAKVAYKLNAAVSYDTLVMTNTTGNTYTCQIPSYTYNNKIWYHVIASDNSSAHNIGLNPSSGDKWFYIKQGPTVVIIGTGTTGQYNLPTNGDYNYSWGAMLYKSNEINYSGPIDSIAFYVGNTPASYLMTNQKVFIGHTNVAAYGTAQPDTTTMTVAFSGSTTFNGAGWYKIKLQNSFYYNGTSNLLIYWVNRDGSYVTGYPTFNCTTTTDYMATYKYSDTYSSVFPTSTGTQTYSRPNLRIAFITTNYGEDAGISQINEPNGVALAGSSIPVKVTLKNFGVNTLIKATIGWKLDGVTQTAYDWTGSLAQAVSSSPITIATQSFTTGSHTIKAWTSLPNDSIDENHMNDTTSVSFYGCATSLSGTYTVGGATADYPAFADVMTALNNCGVSGPTVFKINSGTYNNQLTFYTIAGASATNTVTFMPNTGATVVITNSSTTSTLKLNGTDYLIFDGSNNGTTTRDMTITNTSTAASTAAIWMASAGTGAGCSYVTVKNCNISAGSNTSTTYGICAGGTTIGSNGDDNDNLTIRNNTFTTAYNALWIRANSTGVIDNLLISANIIGSNTPANYIIFRGIDLQGATAPTIEKNIIFNLQTTNSINIAAIDLGQDNTGAKINKNEIYGIRSTSSSGYGAYGINLSSGTNVSDLLISNNFISDIVTSNYSATSTTYNPFGIRLTGGANIKVYNNSINMFGAPITGTNASMSAALLITTTSVANVDIRNNIFANSMTGVTGTKSYCLYVPSGYSFSGSTINYNDYYPSGTYGNVGYSGSNQLTLVNWQTFTTQDANSVSTDPVFTSNTNLHTFSNSVNNIATPIAAVTDDIDGETRNATTPDIGADEFTPLATDLGILSVIAPLGGCGLGATENVTIQLKNTGGTTITTADLFYKLNNGTPVHEVFNGSIAPNATYNYTFTQQADLSATLNYTFKFYIALTGDQNILNDTLSNYTISNGWDFYTSAYTMGFEPTENISAWSKLDVNADGSTWTYPYSSSSYAHTGSNSAKYTYNSTNAADDWMFSRCIYMNAGNSYKISYWYRSENTTDIESLDLKVGNSTTAASMTTTLVSTPSLASTTYTKATAIYTPATTGTYYFGWHAYSVANAYNIYVDDINISLLPAQEASIVSMTAPVSGCGLGTENVTIKISNNGGSAINGNLTAYYKPTGGSVVSQAVTATIASTATYDFTFTTPLNMAVTTSDSTFKIKTWINLTGDPFASNDSISKDIQSSHTPANPVVTSDTVPYGGIATLQATAADPLYWYAASTGGTSIATGSTFVTPNLYITTAYYVQAVTPGGTTSWTFDNDLQGWTAQNPCSSSSNFSWNSDGGNGALYAADPTTYSYQLVTSPSVSVAGNATVNLSFNHRYGTESTYDEGYCAYKLDNGAWTQFTPTVNAYNGSETIGNDPLNGCVSITKSCYTGTQATFITSSGSINTTGASNIQLAFVFTSDVSGGSTGWFINDVTIGGGAGGCASARVPDTAYVQLMSTEAGIIDFPSPVSGCTNGTENVIIHIRNNGSGTINPGFTASYRVNGSTPVTETVSNQILAGDTLTYTFTTPLTAGVTSANHDSIYNVKAYIALAGDNFNTNDTISSSFKLNYTPPAPVVNNASIPYGTTANLTATSTDSLYWFTSPSGGIPVATGSTFTTPILFATTPYYVEARTGSPSIKITEVTQYSSGTGATSPYPSWFTTSDWDGLEITNLGSATADLTGYTVHIEGPATLDYSVPAGVTLAAGEVMILSRYGASADDPAHKFYVMSTTASTSSGVQNGYYIKNAAGTIVDAIATDGYSFSVGSGVTSLDWSGSIASSSGLAGAIRTISDNNTSSDWAVASTSSPQTIGALNPTLTIGNDGGGCASNRTSDTVFVTGIPLCDMAVISMDSPNSGIELTTTEQVTIKVKNFGTASASNVPVNYKINAGTPVNEIITGPINAGDTVIYTFATPADLSAFATYQIKAYTSQTCDLTHVNDTVLKTVTNDSLIYCSSGATSTGDCDISNVTVSTLNNGVALPVLSNTSCVNTYSDFTTLSPVLLTAGISYPISVSQCNTGTTFWGSLVNVYLDYNRNGVWDLPQEKIFSSSTSSTVTTVSGIFTVPTTGIVTDAPLRMRVVLDESDVAPACGTYTWGETEDYTVMISPQIPHDAGVISILNPIAIQAEGAIVPVRVIVKNFGTDTIFNSSNMHVNYAFNGGAPVSTLWNIGSLAPLATDTITLPNITLPAGQNNICAYTILTGDTNTINDQTCKAFYATPNFDAGVTKILQPGVSVMAGASSPVQVVFKNFGSDTLFTFSLAYTMNGGTPVSQIWIGSLIPNDSDTLMLANFTAPSNTFTLCAYTSMTTDGDHSNDTLCKSVFGVPSSNLPYYDDFEGTAMWYNVTEAPGSSWELGTPAYGITSSAHSPVNAWDVNLSTTYGTNANCKLYTQMFDFTGVTDAKLSFWRNNYTETSYDGTNLEYSTDGTTWQPLGTLTDPLGVNWYNSTISGGGSHAAWAGSTSTWIKSEYTLSVLNNIPAVQFRFVFRSDGSGQYDGFSIDDFSITIPSPIDAGVEAILKPLNQTSDGGSYPVKVRIRNFGTDTLFTIPLAYTINGGAPVIATWSDTLAPNDTTSYSFATPFISPAGQYSICAYTSLTADGDHMNDTTCKTVIGIPVFNLPYTDNFEGPTYWLSSDGKAQWEWGIPSASLINTAHSPTHVWATNVDGDYIANMNDNLYSPVFNLSPQMDTVKVEFWHWYNTEAGTDGGTIQYTINGGVNWHPLGIIADALGTNWCTSNINGNPTWNGNSSGWVKSTYSIPKSLTYNNFASDIQFRFNFYSNATTNYNGWAIDDFAVTVSAIPTDAGVTSIVSPATQTNAYTNTTVTVTLKNYGTTTLTSIPVKYTVNNGTPVSETWTGSLLSNATTNYTFATTFVSPATDYSVCAYTSLTADAHNFNDTACTSIQSLPALYDAGVTKIVQPSVITSTGSNITVTATIKNYGLNTLTSIPVAYSVNAGALVSGTWTGTLLSGDSINYTIPTPYIGPSLPVYTLCVKSVMPTDLSLANDQKCISLSSNVGISESSLDGFYLGQNMPNPVNDGITTIEYIIPQSGTTRFVVTNSIGEIVYNISNTVSEGKHKIEIPVNNLGSGIYYYYIEFNSNRLFRKMVIAK